MRLNLLCLRRKLICAARIKNHAVLLDRRQCWIDVRRAGRDFRSRRQRRIGRGNRCGRSLAERQFILIFGGHAGRRDKHDPRVRIGDGRQFQELIHRPAPFAIEAFQLDADAGAGEKIFAVEKSRIARAGVDGFESCRRKIIGFVVDGHLRPVGLGVHRQLDVVGIFLGAGTGVNHHRLAGGDQAIHPGGADADSLLSAAHLQAVKFAAEEQPPEDIFDLLADDARAVVDDGDAISRRFGCRRAIRLQILDDDCQIWQYTGVFAGVQRVVDGFLDAGEQRLARVVKAEQMAIFGEKLGYRDILLLPRHRFGRLPHPAIFG
jgi:hypothetical protein